MLTIELALKSTVLLAVTGLTVALLKKNSAALRHLIWSLAFAGLALLPLLSSALPVLNVPVAERFGKAELIFRADAVAKPMASVAAKTQGHFPDLQRINWTLVLTLLWAGGSAASLAQILIGWRTLERLRARSAAFSEPQQGVALLEIASGSMPMTYGLFRPVIFLPADAKQWPAERLNIVVKHELAHVQRGDARTHVLARATLGLYWWNPLAWWAWREFLKEQELATDDLVLAAGACCSDYASHLLAIARGMRSPVTSSLAVAMANESQLAGRVKAILDTRRDRSAPRRMAVSASVVVTVMLVAPLAAMQQTDTAKPAVSNLLVAGDEALDQGKFGVAKAAYEKFLNTNPKGADAARGYIRRGTSEMALKDYHSAIGDFQQAQASDAASVSEALMWQALANENLRNVDSASNLFEQAVAASDPNSPGTAALFDIYGQFLTRQGQPDRAKSMRERAVELRKDQKPSPSTSPWSADAVRAGGDVVSPKLLSKVEPAYSTEARLAKYSGTILLRVIIGTDGKTHDIRIVRGLGAGLDEKAIDAVSQWTFDPGTKNGQPVNVRASIEVSFRLL